MGDLILAVNIPLETVTEITDAGSKTVERKVFPRLCAGQDGDDRRDLASGPQCAGGHRLCRLWKQAHSPHRGGRSPPWAWKSGEVLVTYQVGDNVRITDGALESFLGIVEEIDTERQKVRVVDVHVRPGRPRWNWTWIKSSPSDPAAVPRAWGGVVFRSVQPHFHNGGALVAQKVTGYVKLQIPAGKATPAPPVGPLWVSTA